MEYYDIRVPLIGSALLRYFRQDNMQPIETTAFDTLYRYSEGNYVHMTARLGRTVVRMGYTGNNPDKAESLFYDTFGR